MNERQILLNGKPYALNEKLTIAMLLERLNIAHKIMAIAINTYVVKSHQWGDWELHDGDEVEILDFVGGG
ncbi:sulfur carrier protein ThiS [Helicobacter sp. MIT 05-5293]|uniref:sulfur carrier protein ThiS n=1 Tax=Helicobacter sp. MIT 05-5293 TaxID=1548149 RepID=UPI00051DAD68|nr:sulfur carrier protein ThiS [Helicobacter sp. MIT 05-5293]TLD81016.1 sulfur carrier protein ThiS [Helicobacter sp. MIT 05-5293]